MLMVVARLKPAEGKADELLAVLKALAEEVKAKEPGCTQYQLCRAKDGTLVMIEGYRDQEALNLHAQSEHIKLAFPKLGACLEGAPQIELLPTLA